MSIVEKLQKARDLVASGWGQQFYANRDETGKVCYCALGAIKGSLVLYTATEAYGPAYSDMRRAVAEAIGVPPNDDNTWARIADWNDTPGRTQAEVIAAFDKAIEMQNAKAEVSV